MSAKTLCKPLLRVTAAGSMDDGRTTLIGRLLTAGRRFLITDAPSQESPDAEIILVDARLGLTQRSRRQAHVAWQLGVRRLIVAVNKMDLVRYEQEMFERIQTAWNELSGKLPGVRFHLLPVSALQGDNVVEPSPRMPWYGGMTLLELLETIEAPPSDIRTTRGGICQ
jgi:sulfate adenylyltransferase subunit 1